MIEASKDITLNEVSLRLGRSVFIGRSTLGVWLRKASSHSKKTAHALEQERPDLLES
jgi:putative transposase